MARHFVRDVQQEDEVGGELSSRLFRFYGRATRRNNDYSQSKKQSNHIFYLFFGKDRGRYCRNLGGFTVCFLVDEATYFRKFLDKYDCVLSII